MTSLALVSEPSETRCRHAARQEYFDWLRGVFNDSPASVRSRRYLYNRFIRHWPDLQDWFAEPLLVRLDLQEDRVCWQSASE